MTSGSPFRRTVTGRVSVVAHRGASKAAPENTMAAFRLAAEAAADLVELDVHLTADDALVVIHDDTLDRTTSGHGPVRLRTLAQIRALDASAGHPRYPGLRVPTLDEVASWAADAGVTLSVEIKQPSPVSGRARYPRIAERVAGVLRAHGLAARALVHSFDHPTIRELRDLLPEATTAISYGGGTFVDPLVLATAARSAGIHPWWEWVSPGVCRAAHEAGLHVHAWGLPEPPDPLAVARLVAAGVDSLDAADPVALRSLLISVGASAR